jgi:hypothetical protein
METCVLVDSTAGPGPRRVRVRCARCDAVLAEHGPAMFGTAEVAYRAGLDDARRLIEHERRCGTARSG